MIKRVHRRPVFHSPRKETRSLFRSTNVRNEADETAFPEKICLKVKGRIVELTKDGWDSQDLVSILQDMGLSFTRAYGYGYYCADKTCYNFLCKALKKDDKAQKAVDAGKPITKASFIKGMDVVVYVMNKMLQSGNAHIKIGESRMRRFENLSVEDDAVEVSLEDIIDDSCQIFRPYAVEYQLDSDLNRWTYTIETGLRYPNNRIFSLDVQELSLLSDRSVAVYDVELGEITGVDFEPIKSKEFKCALSGDWKYDMRSLCSSIVNWARDILDKECGK